MFPGVYGFHWEPAHLIFLGIFFTVVLIVFGVWMLSLKRCSTILKSEERERRLWKLEFTTLPADERKCRHSLTGDLEGRVCRKGFECQTCETHKSQLAKAEALAAVTASMPDADEALLYHRGHTWVRPEDDGTVSIGLDEFASRLVGLPDRLDLPAPGARLSANGTGWRMIKKGVTVRVLSPVDGEVVDLGDAEDDWVMRVRTDYSPEEMTHLLRPAEASAWLTREMERLQAQVAAPDLGPVLADGGSLIDDLSEEQSRADWDRICSSFFLQS